jgi:thioredoxin-like negative regulator of GroEL
MINPILNKLASGMKIVKVNVDKRYSLAEKYDVMTIPAAIRFRDGHPEKRIGRRITKQSILELTA